MGYTVSSLLRSPDISWVSHGSSFVLDQFHLQTKEPKVLSIHHRPSLPHCRGSAVGSESRYRIMPSNLNDTIIHVHLFHFRSRC